MDRGNAGWLSPDPVGPVDSLNLFAFAGGTPQIAADPTGLYEKDFHFYAVYYLARVVGFDGTEAMEVAWSSQSVDDHPETSPTRFVSAAIRPARLDAFHFLAPRGGLVVEGNYIAVANTKRSQAKRDLFALGIALHSLADTFAHAGFSTTYELRNMRQGGPFLTGHADQGHLPDYPFLDAQKAIRAAKAVHSVLEESSRAMGHMPLGTWTMVEPRFTRLFETWGSEADRVNVWKDMIWSDLATRVDYNSFIPPSDWMDEFLSRAREQRSYVVSYERQARPTTIGAASQP